jgi:sugar phosphate isomerase/epimerase
MSALNIVSRGGSLIRIGYRSVGLTQELDLDGKMALCQELGMTVLEPQITEREVTGPDVAAALRSAADKAGIEIPSIGKQLPLTDPAADAEMAVQTQLTIDCAKAGGIAYVFTMANHPPAGIPQPRTWQLTVDRIRSLADRLGAEGIRLALEPEWFLQSVERMRRMVRDVNHPNVYVNFDPTNFYIGGSDPLDIFTDFNDRILSGHIKDAVYRSDRKNEIPVGEGEVEYPRIFYHLMKRGRPMTMFIEHCGASTQVRAAAAHVRRVLSQLHPLQQEG